FHVTGVQTCALPIFAPWTTHLPFCCSMAVILPMPRRESPTLTLSTSPLALLATMALPGWAARSSHCGEASGRISTVLLAREGAEIGRASWREREGVA